MYFPAAEKERSAVPRQLLFCLPGGGASAEYYDLAPKHSFAKIMSRRGYDVITMDHPGTATNPLPASHAFLTPHQSVEYITAALIEWRRQTSLEDAKMIGIGHSMGGMMITLLNARLKAFQGLALLGSSAGGLEWGLSDKEKTYIDKPDDFARDIETLTLEKFQTPFPPSTGGPSGKSIVFGGETETLTARLRDVSCELYAAGGMMSMTKGSFGKEVEAIERPIFFAFGDHDIGIPPEDVSAAYVNSPSTELLVLQNTGHNHFAFSSILTLCKSLDYWAAKLA